MSAIHARALVRLLAALIVAALAIGLLPQLSGTAAATGSLPTGGGVFPSDCFGDYWQTRFAVNQAVCVNGRVQPAGSISGDSTIHIVPVDAGANPASAVASRRIVFLGTFLDEPVWLPDLVPGSYHLVVDNLSTGAFSPGQGDYVYPERIEVSGSRLEGYDFDVAGVKAQARADHDRLVSDRRGIRIGLTATVLASVFSAGMNWHLYGLTGNLGYAVTAGFGVAGIGAFASRSIDAVPDIPFYPSYDAAVMVIGSRIIFGLYDAKIESYDQLANDPADPDYDRLDGPDLRAVEARVADALDGDPLLAAAGDDAALLPQAPGSDNPISLAIADMANATADQAALVMALMHSNERFRGARDADDLPWAVAHGEALIDHADALVASYELSQSALRDMADGFEADGEPDPASEADLAQVQDAVAGGFSAAERRNLRRSGFTEADQAELHASIMEIDPEAVGDGDTVASHLRSWADGLDASMSMYTELAEDVRAVLDALRSDLGDPDVPAVTVVLPDAVDPGEVVTATAEVTGGEGDVTLAWDLDGNGRFDDAAGTSVDISFHRPGPNPVAVRATDARGIPAMARGVVDVVLAPVTTLVATPVDSPLMAQPGDEVAFAVTGADAAQVTWLVDDQVAASGSDFDLVVPRQPGSVQVEAQANDGDRLVAARRWVVLIDDDMGGADTLAVNRQSESSVAAGDDLGMVTVTLVGADGQAVPRDDEPVVVELVADDGAVLAPGAGLEGTTTASTGPDGTATFTDLTITGLTSSGTYRLLAAHAEDRLAAATSDQVTVTVPTRDAARADVSLDGLSGTAAPATTLTGTLRIDLDDPDDVLAGDVTVDLDLRDPALGPLGDPATSVRDAVLDDLRAVPDVIGAPQDPASIDGTDVALSAEIAADAPETDAVWVVVVRDTDGRMIGAQTAALSVREPIPGDPGASAVLTGLPERLEPGETVTFALELGLENPAEAAGDIVVQLEGPTALGDGDAEASFGAATLSPDGIVGEPTAAAAFGGDGMIVEVTVPVAADARPGGYTWRVTLADDRGVLAGHQAAGGVPAPPARQPEASASLSDTADAEQGDQLAVSLTATLDDPDEVVDAPLSLSLDLRDPAGGDLLDPSSSVLGDVTGGLSADPDVLDEPVAPAQLREGVAAVVSAQVGDDARVGDFVWVLEVRDEDGRLVAVDAAAQSIVAATAPSVTFEVTGLHEEFRPGEPGTFRVEVAAVDPAGRLDDELWVSWDIRTDAGDPDSSLRDVLFDRLHTSPSGFFEEPVWTERLRTDGRRVAFDIEVAFDAPTSDLDGFPLVLEARDADGGLVARSTASSMLVGEDVRLPGTGGPVILTGIDPELGPTGCSHGCLQTWQNVLAGVLERTRTTGSGVVVIGANGGQAVQWWTNIIDGYAPQGVPGLGVPVDFVNSVEDIVALDFADYAVIGVATSTFQLSSGGITNAQNEALNARASDIATFINRGGGLLGHTQDRLSNPYAYISGVGTIVQSTSANDNLTITEAGFDAGVRQDFEGCCWHTSFAEWPDFMEPLAFGGGGQVQILGGRQVGIATGITLTPFRAAVDAGAPIELVAVVEEDAEPVGGVEVTFAFADDGAHGGTTMTAITGSDGTATVTKTGSAVGGDTVEASYLDSNGDERVSNFANLRWRPIESEVVFSPAEATRTVGAIHQVEAVVTERGSPAAGVEVIFEITGTHDEVEPATVLTDDDGVARFSYEGSELGEDVIDVVTVDSMGKVWQAQLAVDWVDVPIVPQCVDLIAGQHANVGQVCVIHDDDELTVTYTTISGWSLAETHLAVGHDLDEYAEGGWLNRNDNPRPGHFPHTGTHEAVSAHSYTIPLSDIGGIVDVDELIVAAHAVVGGAAGQETAWAAGTRFTEQGNWAMWFAYDLP